MITDEIFNWEPFEYEKASRNKGKKDHEVYIYEKCDPRSNTKMCEVKMSADLVRESGIKGKAVRIERDHEVFRIVPDKNGKEIVRRGGRFGGKGLAMALRKATGQNTFKGEAISDGSVIFK